jgi:hypothetical protein
MDGREGESQTHVTQLRLNFPLRLRSRSWTLPYNRRMDTKQVLAELDAEIARLEQVRRLLAGGRKPKRTMSAEGRARVAAAQRKRWAARA